MSNIDNLIMGFFIGSAVISQLLVFTALRNVNMQLKVLKALIKGQVVVSNDDISNLMKAGYTVPYRYGRFNNE